MGLIHCCSALLLLAFIPKGCHGGNILVLPTEGSHWINMDILVKALHSRGHNITVVRSNNSWYIKEKSSYYNSYTVQVERSIDQKFMTEFIGKVMEFETGSQTLTEYIGMMRYFLEIHHMGGELVSAMLEDKELMRILKDSKFDLVLTDPTCGLGVILAKYLNLPLVYNVRMALAGEAHLAIAPSPLSFVPVTGSGNTDKMTFIQRVKNVFWQLQLFILQEAVTKGIYQKLCDKYLGSDINFNHLMLEADIWLMRVDFVLEFPRPTMPNVVYIGGFQCEPAMPLPEHLEEFVQSSGEHGVIIMSLGSFVKELPADITNKIAATFAKLPQRVIWRHKGARPATLGNNTLIVDWMPQKDLLGHPKVKLFVAHGGTNGIYEALCHGVPVVGLPLFYDQYDNLVRLKERGAAKFITIQTVLKDNNFQDAIQEVLNEPSCRSNMQRLSRLHKDQPMKPLDTALFWIEFVMRHKGAAHLRTESYRLPWYSYHSVDVFLFLAGALLLVIFTVFIFIRCLCTTMCKSKVKCD
ncbi:UDP-glucuronosyltransferase 2B1-like isoform X2 [Eleginops maclovinus]